MIGVDLYYDESANYARTPLDQVFRALDDLNKEKGQLVAISKSECKVLSERMLKGIADDIRSIKPQARGSVVTSGGFHLPLSGTKKLNLKNIPILLVRNESGPLYVFPCKSGEIYYDVIAGIKFLRDNLPNLIELPAGAEELITSIIRNRPELIEEGLSLVSSEFETSRGKGDLLFKDVNDRMLLVEVEREAFDQSIGQILRLCAGYENQQGLEPGTIRAAIACIRINDNVQAAAKRAGIEVRMIDPLNLGENHSQEASEYFSS